MLFNSFIFLFFFSVFFALYWFVFSKSVKWQNLLILAGSYFFYFWCDARFLWLLIASSLLNYILGIAISKSHSQKGRNFFLFIGLLQGLGSLFLFKYFDFFILSVQSALEAVHLSPGLHALHLLMPLGISFYTFRTIGYL